MGLLHLVWRGAKHLKVEKSVYNQESFTVVSVVSNFLMTPWSSLALSNLLKFMPIELGMSSTNLFSATSSLCFWASGSFPVLLAFRQWLPGQHRPPSGIRATLRLQFKGAEESSPSRIKELKEYLCSVFMVQLKSTRLQTIALIQTGFFVTKVMSCFFNMFLDLSYFPGDMGKHS